MIDQNSKSEFEFMQDEIVHMLQKTPELSNIEILSEEKNSLMFDIQNALNNLGMGVVVQTLNMAVNNPDVPGPFFDSLGISILVNENVLLNRQNSDRTALKVARLISRALHHKKIKGAAGPLYCTGIFLQPDPEILTYAVDFKIGQ